MSVQNAVTMIAAGQAAGHGRARHALVEAVDPNSHAVKVSIQPEGTISGWIPDPGIACAGLRISCPAEIGTQVLVVPVEGDAEHPVIVGRLFDAQTQPPMSPLTGKPVQPGEIGIFLKSGIYFHVSDKGISMKGNFSVDGDVVATGDVSGRKISLAEHVHGGVATGSGVTSQPRS